MNLNGISGNGLAKLSGTSGTNATTGRSGASPFAPAPSTRVPPWASAIRRERERPRPAPPAARARLLFRSDRRARKPGEGALYEGSCVNGPRGEDELFCGRGDMEPGKPEAPKDAKAK